MYTGDYESTLVRGDEDPRPWDIIEVVRGYTKTGDVLLDIGCGTAHKLVQLGHDVAEIYGLEPNPEMRARAGKNIREANLTNTYLVDGRADNIAFEDGFFDIVTCMVAPHDTYEVYRVLRPGGYAVLEKLGDRDKWNIKDVFGDDELGPRGQFAHLREGQRVEIYQDQFGRFFSDVSITSGSWKTYYSTEGLALLLQQTPTVRGFDRERDAEALEEIQRRFTTPRGIETQQDRILICARK